LKGAVNVLRLSIFIIALLLLGGAVDPSKGWFIALAVLAGLSLVSRGPFSFLRWFGWRRWQGDRFARKMERRFEREWSLDADW
jgi:hypothetical protein